MNQAELSKIDLRLSTFIALPGLGLTAFHGMLKPTTAEGVAFRESRCDIHDGRSRVHILATMKIQSSL